MLIRKLSRHNQLMKGIRTLIILISFLAPISCSINESNKTKKPLKSKLTLKANLVDRGYYTIGGQNPDSTIVYHVNIELINNSADSTKFISMSCSHEDMFVVKDSINCMIHPYYLCFSNYPTIVTLASNESYSESVMIRPKEKELKESITTRVGFRFIEVNSKKLKFEEIIEKYDNRHSKNITVWSNLVQIEI